MLYKASWKLFISSFIAGIGTFQMGWNVGVINNPQEVIGVFVNNTLANRSGSADAEIVKGIMATIVAIFAGGGLVGALVAGWIGDRLGRINGMLLNTLISTVGGIFMLTSVYVPSFEMIIVGRFVVGFSSGCFTGLVPVYLNEIAPIHIRGKVGLITQFGVVTGLFCSQVFGLSMIMGNEKLWNVLLGMIVIFAVIQAIGLQFCPPSPRYVLYFKNDERKAKKALAKLRDVSSDLESEIEEIKEEIQHNKNINKMTLCAMLHHSGTRMTLLVGVVLHASQQFSGINNIFYYSSILFQSVNVAKDKGELATLGVGIVMIVITCISVPLIERTGRKILHIGGLIGCMVTSIMFTIFFSFNYVKGLNYLSVISALLFVASFGIGPGSIPWLIIPELFPEGCRSAATSTGISVNWLSNLIVGLIFPYLMSALNNLIFLPFIVIHVLCIIFFVIYMPETKGKRPVENNVAFESLGNDQEGVDNFSHF